MAPVEILLIVVPAIQGRDLASGRRKRRNQLMYSEEGNDAQAKEGRRRGKIVVLQYIRDVEEGAIPKGNVVGLTISVITFSESIKYGNY